MAFSSGIIFDIKRFAVHDGPGIRTTIFFKGCPLRCRWCHNPESFRSTPELVYDQDQCIDCGFCADVCPEKVGDLPANRANGSNHRCRLCGSCAATCSSQATRIIGRRVSVDELMVEIEKDRIFFDQSGGGVTFSGGEPLAQPDFLLASLSQCKAREIHTAVDTSGYAAASNLRQIADLVDLFLFDLKLIDPEEHRRWTGVSNQWIHDNLQLLTEFGKKIQIRIPLIPGVTDTQGNVAETARFLRNFDGVRNISLLPYHPMASAKHERLGFADPESSFSALEGIDPEKVKEIFVNQGFRVQIGG